MIDYILTMFFIYTFAITLPGKLILLGEILTVDVVELHYVSVLLHAIKTI